MARLSDMFGPGRVVRDAQFALLDEVGAQSPESLVYCQTLPYVDIANANPNVRAVITTPALCSAVTTAGCACDDDPRRAFFRLYARWHECAGTPRAGERGEGCSIHPTAIVSPHSRIGDRVTIGAHAVVESGVAIGDDTHVAPGAVLGAEGLLTVWQEDGTPLAVRHAGGLTVGRGVVILAGAVIAKSIYRACTRIGDYTQIGALTYVSHGVDIGERCVIAANCAITGRVQIADRVTMGASASVSPAVRIGPGAEIGIGSTVVRDVAAGQIVSGNFAVHRTEHLRRFLLESRRGRTR